MDSAVDKMIFIKLDQELMPVVPEYLENRCLDCVVIEKLLGTGDLESIQMLGHRMKGSGGSFGFDEISDIGEELELAAQVPDVEGIKSAVVRLKRYLARVSVAYI